MVQQKLSTKEQLIEQEMGAVYDFLVRAEQNDEHFTYKKLCEIYPHDISTIRKYAKNYWSWFLVREGTTRPFTFSCHRLAGYPKQYFIDAHKPNQGQYFHHFVLAMQEAAARVEEERGKRAEARVRDQQLHPSTLSDGQETIIAQQEVQETLVPEQELPGKVHIEKIDDEIEDGGESNGESMLVAGASNAAMDELPLGEDDPGRSNHHVEDGASEPVEDVSPVITLTEEVVQFSQTTIVPSPDTRQEGQRGFTTKTLVTAAVCLAVVVGLTIWWVVSKR